MDIPITDGFARGMIYRLVKKWPLEFGKRDRIMQKDLYDYDRFCELHDALRKKYCKDIAAKDFDKYLWQYAKKLSKAGKNVWI